MTRSRHQGLAPLLLLGLSGLSACGTSTAPNLLGLSPCGNFGPDFGGVTINASHDPAIRLAVGDTLRITATVTRPVDVAPPPPGCPKAANAGDFKRVTWGFPLDGAFDVDLTSCPCRIVRTYDDTTSSNRSGWTHNVVAEADGEGVYAFDVRARAPGSGSLAVGAYTGGPCGGQGPNDPLVECGPFALDLVFIVVK
jgi:hypothetical protein